MKDKSQIELENKVKELENRIAENERKWQEWLDKYGEYAMAVYEAEKNDN